MSLRNKGIIAYGTEEDRQKLAVLSQLSNRTASDWIIKEIRRRYEEAFGDTPPSCIVMQQT